MFGLYLTALLASDLAPSLVVVIVVMIGLWNSVAADVVRLQAIVVVAAAEARIG